MKERPILFSAPMVWAILEGRKTQTRRIVIPQPDFISPDNVPRKTTGPGLHPYIPCPYGQPGDRLWVRETFSGPHYQSKSHPRDWIDSDPIWYWADGNPEAGDWTPPKPSIHMPRWASRLLLEVVSVRVERLNAISVSDAIAEGYDGSVDDPIDPSVKWYAQLWESINGSGGWAANPWVWVVEFKRVQA